MSVKETKYRPSLTARSLHKIMDLAKNEVPLSAESVEIIGILAPYLAKVSNGAIAPAYATKGRQSVEDKLGLGSSPETVAAASKEEYWKACWQKLEDKGRAALTLEELQAADEYRYLNDLMTPEEEATFEASK